MLGKWLFLPKLKSPMLKLFKSTKVLCKKDYASMLLVRLHEENSNKCLKRSNYSHSTMQSN